MPENVSESPETPDPAELADPEAPEVVAHSDEEEDYPCSGFLCFSNSQD
jgi:hypothetical protein